ncbi:hypothetical protein [Aliiroseovarius lamellibrachiae]|nr:hypothetical protein [Aliiroseovarius lamellibrachiae]
MSDNDAMWAYGRARSVTVIVKYHPVENSNCLSSMLRSADSGREEVRR